MDHTLKLLKQMAHGIAKQFGTSCEVVIHDLNKDLETSIVHIENGQVTNFSINYDITALLTIDSALGSLLHTEPETDTYTVSKPHSPQTITRNVEELLNDLMQQGVALVGKPVALMTKEDKIQVIRYLNDAGAFLITKSGDKVANLLNISKFTLYSYMDAGK